MSDVRDTDAMNALNVARAQVQVAQDQPVFSTHCGDYPVRSGHKQVDEYLNGKVLKRPSVAEYLQSKHREALLKRMPKFENDTNHAIDELQRDVSSLSFQMMITNCLLSGIVIVGALSWLA